MKKKLFKLFFKKEYDLFKFYEREYQINTCAATVEGFKTILPHRIEDYDLDIDEAAYIKKETNDVFISAIKHTNRNKTQNLAALYLELKDRGYVT